MNVANPSVANLAAELRAAFDRGFAEPPMEGEPPALDFLALGIAGKPFAVALSQVATLFADREITPLPTSAPGFLGVANLRGEVVPVFSLGATLGEPTGSDRLRWLIVTGHGRVAAFAVEELEGHLRIPLDRIAQAESAQGHVKASIVDEEPRPIIDLFSLIDEIQRQVGIETRPRGS